MLTGIIKMTIAWYMCHAFKMLVHAVKPV